MTDPALLRRLVEGINSVGPHPGWRGVFTRARYPGAWPAGSEVVKANSEPGDSIADGTVGKVLGSIGHPDLGPGYFVEWAPAPRVAVFVRGTRLALVGAS